jgi:hypothetical protein
LKIINCSRLDVIVLSENDEVPPFPIYRVEIQRCEALTRIEVRRNVFFMKIEKCESLKRMEITRQVDRLRLCRCPELQSMTGLRNIVWLYDEDSKEFYEEDQFDPSEGCK